MNTKYNIGQDVFVCYKDEKLQTYNVYKTKIKEICLRENGLFYFVDGVWEEFSEQEVFDSLESLFQYLEKVYNEER